MEHSGHIKGLVGPYTFDNWALAEGAKDAQREWIKKLHMCMRSSDVDAHQLNCSHIFPGVMA